MLELCELYLSAVELYEMPFRVISVDEEYKKYNNLRKEEVEVLKQWIAKQSHLPQLTELQIIWFIHSCYYKIEPTKKTIENYSSLISDWPEYFSGRDPNLPLCKQAVDNCLVATLPQPTPEGHLVVFATVLNRNSSKFNMMTFAKLLDMIGMLWYSEVGIPDGMVIILDIKNFTLGHMSTISISGLKKLFFYMQEAMPVRLRSFHLINAGLVLDTIMPLIKPFMKKSLLEMLHVHAKVDDSLFRFVPKEFLPSDYGGKAPSVTELQATMKRTLLRGADFLIEMEKLVADVPKTSGYQNLPLSRHGVDGSFKKLEID